jgi:hypothetical protein
MARIATLLTVVFAFACVATASATTFYVSTSPGPTPDCLTPADACPSVEAALTEHRNDSDPDADVISIGSGTFDGFDASSAADNGLTVRGTIVGGVRETTIAPQSGEPGYSGTLTSTNFAVRAGGCGVATVLLRDLVIDTQAEPALGTVTLEEGSDLLNVRALTPSNSTADAAVEACASGTKIESSEVVAGNTAVGVLAAAGLTVTDTTVSSVIAPAVIQAGLSGRIAIRRSRIESAAPANATMETVTDVLLDSTLVVGGLGSLAIVGGDPVLVRDSTLDSGAPGRDGAGAADLVLASAFDRAGVRIESSILPDGVAEDPSYAPTTGELSCAYSDLPQPTAIPGWDIACATGGTSTNVTSLDPLALFQPSSPFSWRLAPGSPAIDSGVPGPLASDESATDVAGAPRLAIGLAGSCPIPRRDRGAYEAIAVPCPVDLGVPATTSVPPVVTLDGGVLDVRGEYVHTAYQVFFGDQPARFTIDGFGHISVFPPPGGSGTVDVWAMTPGGRVDLGRYGYPTPPETGPEPPPPPPPAAPVCRRVPSLLGRTLAGARSTLLLSSCRASLRLGTIVPVRTDRRRRVVAQTPAAGRPAPAGVTVRLGYLPLPKKKRR